MMSAERDFTTFLQHVSLFDLQFERPIPTAQQIAVARYDSDTGWWQRRAADSLRMEAGLRAEPVFTETELRIARRVEERRAMSKKYLQNETETRAS